MTLQWILGWWNLLFEVPFGIALAYLGVYLSTGLTFGEVDADLSHDVAVDHDVNVDHDVGVDQDVDAEHDVDADHDADGEHAPASAHGTRGATFALLSFIGLGRAPLSLLLLAAMLTWGIGGFAATQILHRRINDGPTIALVALPIAAVTTLVVVALLARVVGRVIPANEPPATSRRDLVGRPGVAILAIGEDFGLARVSPADDAAGVQLPCRVADGQPAIAAHEPVVVLRYDRLEHFFYVTTPDRLAAFRALNDRSGQPASTPR